MCQRHGACTGDARFWVLSAAAELPAYRAFNSLRFACTFFTAPTTSSMSFLSPITTVTLNHTASSLQAFSEAGFSLSKAAWSMGLP